MANPHRSLHWSGFDLPGRTLREAEVQGYARACWPSGTTEELTFLALQIGVMTALDDAFDASTGSVVDLVETLTQLFPWRDSGGGVRLTGEWRVLRAALAALDVRLEALAPGQPDRREAARGWWRRQAEAQVAAFQRETQWRLEGACPGRTSYLAVAQQSIGVEWTAASLIALDPQTPVPLAGSHLRATTGSIARTVRLANDLHDPERERLEGKAQWLLLRERELLLAGIQREAAVDQARAELQLLIAAEAAQARALVAELNSSHRLGDGLHGLLRIGLAVYAPELALAA
jgi:hypothetical protein